jgi:hydrogenase maturation factor
MAVMIVDGMGCEICSLGKQAARIGAMVAKTVTLVVFVALGAIVVVPES